MTAVSWRWIFYVDLPVGLLALAVLAVDAPGERSARASDDRLPRRWAAGGGLSAIVLVDEPRRDHLGVGLGAGGADRGARGGADRAFLFAESRAPEPILPLSLS